MWYDPHRIRSRHHISSYLVMKAWKYKCTILILILIKSLHSNSTLLHLTVLYNTNTYVPPYPSRRCCARNSTAPSWIIEGLCERLQSVEKSPLKTQICCIRAGRIGLQCALLQSRERYQWYVRAHVPQYLWYNNNSANSVIWLSSVCSIGTVGLLQGV
jgi:hypothetical protein